MSDADDDPDDLDPQHQFVLELLLGQIVTLLQDINRKLKTITDKLADLHMKR